MSAPDAPDPPPARARPRAGRVTFDGLTLPGRPDPQVARRVGAVRSKNGHVAPYEWSDLPASPLVNAVIEATHRLVAARIVPRKSQITKTYLHGSRLLLEQVAPLGARATTHALTPAHIEAAVSAMQAAGYAYGSQHAMAKEMIAALKLLGPRQVTDALWHRLAYVLPEGRPEITPREPYSTAEWERMRHACRAAMDVVLARLDEGGRLLAAGRDPRGLPDAAWDDDANLVWLAGALGPLSDTALAAAGLFQPFRRAQVRAAKRGGRLTYDAINNRLYPRTEDLAPFAVLLLGETGIPLQHGSELTVDCMERPANGRFTIRYVKRRGGYVEKADRYRDGNLGTPGGVIRAVLRATTRLRAHCPSESLWLARTASSGRALGVAAPLNMTDNGILSDAFARATAGEDLPALVPARLRKTWVANNTKRAKAQATPLVLDHTPTTHLNHYARMKALVPLHLEIAHDVMASEREVIVRATVVSTMEEESALQARPEALAERMRCSTEVAREALDGRLDLWMNACTGFYDSPYAPKGQPCGGAPLGLCLDCPNGLITPAKLPAIYSYLNHMTAQRAVQPADVWLDAFGATYRKLVFGILVHFDDAVLRDARAQAETREDLVFLGPELRPYDHLLKAVA